MSVRIHWWCFVSQQSPCQCGNCFINLIQCPAQLSNMTPDPRLITSGDQVKPDLTNFFYVTRIDRHYLWERGVTLVPKGSTDRPALWPIQFHRALICPLFKIFGAFEATRCCQLHGWANRHTEICHQLYRRQHGEIDPSVILVLVISGCLPQHSLCFKHIETITETCRLINTGQRTGDI